MHCFNNDKYKYKQADIETTCIEMLCNQIELHNKNIEGLLQENIKPVKTSM